MVKSSSLTISDVVKTGTALESKVEFAFQKAKNRACEGKECSQEIAEYVCALADFSDFYQRAISELKKVNKLDNGISPINDVIQIMDKDVKEYCRRSQIRLKRLNWGI